MFKKTAIAALVLGFSGAASAAMYAPAPAPACSAGNVTVPCEKTAWDLGIHALYLRTTANHVSGLAVDDVNNDKWGWGFRLEGSYHFSTGNDATLNWTWYDVKHGTSGVRGYRRPRYNIVNFEMGQSVDFGESVDMRFQGGLQYANLKQEGTVTALNATRSSELTGLGPRVGMDASYDFGNGFALTGGGDIAMLVGKTTRNGNTSDSATTFFGLGSKVGVKYTQAMAQGDVTLDLGYQVNVWDADGARVNGDVSLDGIYFGVKWVGNA